MVMQYHSGLGVGHLHTRPLKTTPPSSDPSLHNQHDDEEPEIQPEVCCHEEQGYTAGGGQGDSENETDWSEESDSDNTNSTREESDTDDEEMYDYEN